MNPAFLKKVRLRIKELREMGALYKETKTPPSEIRLSMMLVEDEEFVGHGCLHFFEECPMLYPVHDKELENLKQEFKNKEIEMYPHLI